MSLTTGDYPDERKLVNNSVLYLFDKIIEKIIHTRLYAFLETHNILYEKQFGFRKNNSTIFALMQISEKIKD